MASCKQSPIAAAWRSFPASSSRSWGHFNAYPLVLGRKLAIDTVTATIDEIIKEGRRQGATVVQVNHPFIPYGYFTSVTGGVAPGGFSPAFDLIEINAAAPADDLKVLHTLWNSWNAGASLLPRGGARIRTMCGATSPVPCAHSFTSTAGVDGQGVAQGLKDGHGYVTSGRSFTRR